MAQSLARRPTKLNEVQDKFCGCGTTAGELKITASTLATTDPHVPHTAMHYSLQARVYWTMSVHFPKETNLLAKSVDKPLRRCYRLCLGVDPLDPDGHS